VNELAASLTDPIIERQVSRGTVYLECRRVTMSWFRYRYALLRPASRWRRTLIASLDDLAAMKLGAIYDRGSRKDFVGPLRAAGVWRLFAVPHSAVPEQVPARHGVPVSPPGPQVRRGPLVAGQLRQVSPHARPRLAAGARSPTCTPCGRSWARRVVERARTDQPHGKHDLRASCRTRAGCPRVHLRAPGPRSQASRAGGTVGRSGRASTRRPVRVGRHRGGWRLRRAPVSVRLQQHGREYRQLGSWHHEWREQRRDVAKRPFVVRRAPVGIM